MKAAFELHKVTRKNLLKAIKSLSSEQMNKIPVGFSNNVVWNVGHILITQQLLCYKLSTLDLKTPADFVERYRKGSAPSQSIGTNEIAFLKEHLLKTSVLLQKNYKSGDFKSYSTYETSYGATLNSIEEAINFNNLHEALHLGYVMALKKAL
jgi:hypothetical protein